MKGTYRRVVGGFAQTLRFVSALAIMAMLFLSCADIVLRFFGAPIHGVYDMVSFLGAIAASFAIAQTSLENGHVAVSFVVNKFSKRLQAGIRFVVNVLGLGLFSAIAWQSFVYATDLRASGEISPTIQFPYYPIVYGIAFAAGAVCLVLLLAIAENLAKVSRP
jgi:TRAP-type C4-dicarboxylate transport system permease small subunit